jgi:AmmeMemoRadiSam system protein B
VTALRPAAAAGTFYPSDPAELAAAVDGFIAAASASSDTVPKALIAPHAGYRYSGAIAGNAYARVHATAIERVVMFGPAHRWPVAGLALPSSTSFETPLGSVAVDLNAVEQACALDGVETVDAAHADEHALEVHLPFLQRCFSGDFLLVPFVVGGATQVQVEAVMELLWGGRETLVIVSSDLSHFYDYDTACRLDADTSSAIENLAPEQLHEGGACGRVCIQALLSIATRFGLKAQTVDLRNSGDTAGGREEVVGYGAYVIG